MAHIAAKSATTNRVMIVDLNIKLFVSRSHTPSVSGGSTTGGAGSGISAVAATNFSSRAVLARLRFWICSSRIFCASEAVTVLAG